MTTYIPPKKGAELIFYVGLVSQSTGQFQANPTLAAGDWKVSKDGGAFGNLATLPAVTPASGRAVKVTLSTTEMDADNVMVQGVDAAGDEWDEVMVNIQTSVRQIDDLATSASITTLTGYVDTEVSSILAAVDTEVGDIKTKTDQLTFTVANQVDANALSGGGGLDAAGVRTAVGLASANLDTQLAAIDDAIDAEVGAILADTNELQTDWTNGGRLDLILDARSSQTSVDDLPTNAELATALGTADDATLAAIAALNNLSQVNVRTAIGLASANLDTQLGDIPTNAELTTALGTADDATLAAVAALNNLSSAQAQTAAAAALTAYDPPTKAEMDTALDALPTAAENATATWASGTRTLTSFGTLVADIWANATRTLTAISDSAGVTTLLSRIAGALNITGGKVEANIKEVNDVALEGDGSVTPWGPA